MHDFWSVLKHNWKLSMKIIPCSCPKKPAMTRLDLRVFICESFCACLNLKRKYPVKNKQKKEKKNHNNNLSFGQKSIMKKFRSCQKSDENWRFCFWICWHGFVIVFYCFLSELEIAELIKERIEVNLTFAWNQFC